jgi:phage FluMu gp28-like protein
MSESEDKLPTGENDLKTSVYNEDGAAPSVVIRRNIEEEDLDSLMPFLATELGMLSALDQKHMNNLDVDGEWTWQEYQKRCLQCNRWFISNKPRQVGMSFGFAAKALARGVLSRGNYNAIFTSFKKEEAVNKISYVRQLIEALPPTFKLRIIRDPQQLIEWENPNKTRVKIMSHAQRPIRGINGDVFLDELAFYQIAEEIYTSALPAVLKVKGTIDVTSTPFGKGGQFYEVFTNPSKYPEFERLHIKWWHNRAYLRDSSLEFFVRAAAEAHKMELHERVYTFGSRGLCVQFENALDDESFRQEFEGYFVDEQAAFFNRALILNCMYPDEESALDDYMPEESDFDIPIEEALEKKSAPIIERYDNVRNKDGKRIQFKRYHSIEELHAAIRSGDVSHRLFGGADVGRTTHSSHFVILEEVILADGSTLQIERFNLNRRGWDLPDQQDYYSNIISKGILSRFAIDSNGLGRHMADFLVREYGDDMIRTLHAGGNNKMQDDHMTNLRARMNSLSLALEYNTRTIEDLYAINRVISASKTISYKADEKKKHHADAAWAIAFASLAGTPFGKQPETYSVTTAKSLESLNIKSSDSRDLLSSSDRIKRHFNKVYSGFGIRETGAFSGLANPGDFIPNYED